MSTDPTVADLARECRSSIELQRAKDGTYYWTVKRYFDHDDPEGYDRALTDLATIDKYLKGRYL